MKIKRIHFFITFHILRYTLVDRWGLFSWEIKKIPFFVFHFFPFFHEPIRDSSVPPSAILAIRRVDQFDDKKN